MIDDLILSHFKTLKR